MRRLKAAIPGRVPRQGIVLYSSDGACRHCHWTPVGTGLGGTSKENHPLVFKAALSSADLEPGH